MSNIILRKGIEYIINFNSKKVYGIYIGQKKGILFFIDTIKLNKYSDKNFPCIPDYLIDKSDNDVKIIKVQKQKNIKNVKIM